MELKYMEEINFEKNNMLNEIYSIINTGLIYKKLDPIANKYNLNLDQLGQLNSDVELFLYGKLKSSQLIKTIAENLEISVDVVNEIWKDIDKEIMTEIRSQLRVKFDKGTSIESPPSKPNQISDIEKIGQFTIEPKSPPSSSTLYNDTNLNREDVLKSIEDPMPENRPLVAPLIDHLLTTPVNNTQKVEQREVVDKNINQSPKSYSADPYREQII